MATAKREGLQVTILDTRITHITSYVSHHKERRCILFLDETLGVGHEGQQREKDRFADVHQSVELILVPGFAHLLLHREQHPVPLLLLGH